MPIPEIQVDSNNGPLLKVASPDGLTVKDVTLDNAGVLSVGVDKLATESFATTATGTKQPLDATLTALAGLDAMAGIVVETAADTFTKRTLAAPAAGFTVTNPDGVAGNPTFVLSDDLAALEAMAGTGIVARTAANSYAQRTIIAPAAGITIADGGGVAGNPTLALANDLAALEAMAGTGLVVRTAAETYSQRVITAGSSKLSVTDGNGVAGNPTLDVVEANLSLPNLGGTLPISKGGTGQTNQTAAFNALDPLTAKGDLISNNGTDSIRIPVGTNGQVLTADSTQAAGVVWQAPAGSPSSENYVFAYDNTTQQIANANTWQDLLFAVNAQLNGWTHPAASANFTCGQTDLYLVTLRVSFNRTSTTGSFEARILFNGVEVAGSHVGRTVPVNTDFHSMTVTVIVSATSGQVLKAQIASNATTYRAIIGPVPAAPTVGVSASITVTRLS